MNKLLVAAAAVLALSGSAFAGQPENPGGFGTNRADHIQHELGEPDDGFSGASEWGHTAAARGATNGDQNRDWSENHTDSTPTHGSTNGNNGGSAASDRADKK